MSIKGKAFIAGAYEHPGRMLPDKSIPQIHAEVALGALADAGLSLADVDAYYCGADAPGLGGLAMADYLGLRLRHMDSSDMGGSVYMSHVGHAAAAIAAGKCKVALITLGGRPRTTSLRAPGQLMGEPPEKAFEPIFGSNVSALYALAAQRHMYQYGTTSEQLAEIKVAASVHAQHNPNAVLPKVVTVEDVVNSPMVSTPLHRLDCCLVTDGGGALVVVAEDVAAALDRNCVKVLGHGEAVEHTRGGWQDITVTGGVRSGADAFAEAGVRPADIDYVGSVRLVHHHRAAGAGGPRLLREGRRREVRPRRRPAVAARPTALQHRRRLTVQQPSRQPRRDDQDHRGGTATAR